MLQTVNGNSDVVVRPVFLVDYGAYQDYSVYIRRILVGLSGTANASALVCPWSVNTERILCPSVESFEHPALRLPIFFQQNRRVLLERLGRFKPTILHAFYPGLGQVCLARWLSARLEIPYVLTFHRDVKKWQRFETMLRPAGGIIAPSQTLADQIQKACPTLTERIAQIHVGSFVEDDCRCFADDGRIPSLIAFHSLDRVEVFEPFLRAVYRLVQDGAELLVVIMGKGRKEKQIRRLIRQLGLTPSVTLVPPMQPMRSILSGADIYLHLEDRGLFDARLAEAMAVGLAVVGCGERNSGLLIDGQTAALWNPADELNIYGCLKKSLGQRAETRQLAMNGQAHLRQHNSVSRMVDKLMQTYIDAQQSHKENARQPDEEPVIIG